MTGPEGAHDIDITFDLDPTETKIVIDGVEEKHCRRIRVEQGIEPNRKASMPVVTLELYARSVKIVGLAGEVLEIAGGDDGDEIVEHNFGPGQPGVLRHFKRNTKGCLLCDPAAESRERDLSH